MDYGYGADGVSVQGADHWAKGLTDRRIMQRTLEVGTPVITARTACERMRSTKSGGQKALPLPEPRWSSVMTEGLRGSPVARYENKKIYLAPIPDQPHARVQYHNDLMNLCGLPLRSLVDSMKKAKAKSKDPPARDKSRSPRRQGA